MVPRFCSIRHFVRAKKAYHMVTKPIRIDSEATDKMLNVYYWTLHTNPQF